MQGFDLSTISDCYVGSAPASAIYLSNQLIWPSTPPHDYSQDYLTFTALEPTTFSFNDNNLLYSLDDGQTWTTLIDGNNTPQLSTGDKILWKQTNPTIYNIGIGQFSSTGNFTVSGNIMSLHFGDNFAGQTSLSGKNNAFQQLFIQCNKLISAENLILPATTLSDACYWALFQECTSLTTPPVLPATTLTTNCYGYMFDKCSSLTIAPNLPATTLANSCYYGMFELCTSLTTAPNLSATTLTDSCYEIMFADCTSLTTAPILPAQTLQIRSYSTMFAGCTSLNYVKCLATDKSATDCTMYWLYNTATNGTFVKDANTTWAQGNDGVPSSWTIVNA